MATKNHFSARPPANRVAQLEHDRAEAQLSGAAVIVILALSCVVMAMIIVVNILASTPTLLP